jgi:hypothetical protein
MLKRLPPAVTSIVLSTAAAAILAPTAASAGPCGVTCANANGGHHTGGTTTGGSTGSTEGGTGGTGGTGPNNGCGGITGQQCTADNNAPDAPEHIPTVDVRDTALQKQELPIPNIHSSPRGKSYVRLATSFWIDRGQFRNITTEASVPDQTVTVRAVRQSVTWQLGETTKTCSGMAATTPGSCTYTYQHSSAGQPGGVYRITATITWNVSWACTGTCDEPGGDLGVTTSPSPVFNLPVREIQTESKPG